MRRNLKPVQRQTRADRTTAARASDHDLLSPMENSERLWDDEMDAQEEERDEARETRHRDAAPSTDEKESDESTGPDDALGLYLRQMGAIPLLNRQQELDLARRLETARSRYRRAALANWRTITMTV